MANTIRTLFWLHRSKINREGKAPLIIRLTYQKSKVEKSTGFYVLPENWNVTRQRLKGNKDSAKQINEWIEIIIMKVSSICREEESGIHLPGILEKLFAKNSEELTLLKLILKHNQDLKNRLNNGYTFSTYEKYVFTYNKVKAFVEQALGKKDVLLKDITTKFIMDFDQYLRVKDNNQHNTAVKYCINLKRILNIAVMQGLMQKNPFTNFKTIYKVTPQVYLDEHEVKAIENAVLIKPSLELVRDLFIFQCNTGLAYTDMVGLKESDISVDINGRKWIIKPRQKSGIVSTIPLFPQALAIIRKYQKSDRKETGDLLPHYAIQKYNQYIGEVGEFAKIHKKLSSHVGRRTFGNLALAKGISLNVISKILGHSSTLITQKIYAITTQNIIVNEIKKW